MALGDGYLNVGSRICRGYTQERRELRIVHGAKQIDYCEHKAGRVRQLLGGKFAVREYRAGVGGKYRAFGFTATHPYFSQLRGWLYPEGSKRITRQVLDMLTPEGVAIWYMDDGSARINRNLVGRVTSVATDIATMCSKEEAEDVLRYFAEAHGIEFKMRCNPKCSLEHQWYVQANTEQSRRFVRLVEPFIIPSMRYKIAHVADLDTHECQAPSGNCSQCQRSLFDNRRNGLCSTCYSRRYYQQVRRFKEGRVTRVMR